MLTDIQAHLFFVFRNPQAHPTVQKFGKHKRYPEFEPNGKPGQLAVQARAGRVTIAFAFSVTFVLSKILNRWMGRWVSENEEKVGLDISEHGVRAYA